MNNHLEELLNKKISESFFNSIGYEGKVNFPIVKHLLDSGESIEQVIKKGSENYFSSLKDIESTIAFVGKNEFKNLNCDTRNLSFEMKEAYEKLKGNGLWEELYHLIQKTIIDKFLIEYLYLDYVKFQHDFILSKIHAMLKDESEKINVSFIGQNVIEIEEVKFNLEYKVNMKNIFEYINNEILIEKFKDLIQFALDENIEVTIKNKW